MAVPLCCVRSGGVTQQRRSQPTSRPLGLDERGGCAGERSAASPSVDRRRGPTWPAPGRRPLLQAHSTYSSPRARAQCTLASAPTLRIPRAIRGSERPRNDNEPTTAASNPYVLNLSLEWESRRTRWQDLGRFCRRQEKTREWTWTSN